MIGRLAKIPSNHHNLLLLLTLPTTLTSQSTWVSKQVSTRSMLPYTQRQKLKSSGKQVTPARAQVFSRVRGRLHRDARSFAHRQSATRKHLSSRILVFDAALDAGAMTGVSHIETQLAKSFVLIGSSYSSVRALPFLTSIARILIHSLLQLRTVPHP